MLKPKDRRIEIIPEGEQKLVEVCREGIFTGGNKTLTLVQGENTVEYNGSEDKTFEVEDVDLSDYYDKTETDALLEDKADADDVYTKTEVDDIIDGINTGRFEVVEELPQEGEDKVIYLVPNGGEVPNIYDEYIWTEDGFEKIGTTEIDLSQYYTKAQADELLGEKADKDTTYTKSETDALLGDKQDTLTAGDGIFIGDAEISVANPAPDGFFGDEAVTGEGRNFSTKTTNGSLKSVELLGDTGQASYSGKNMVDISNYRVAPAGQAVVSGDEITVTATDSARAGWVYCELEKDRLVGQTCTVSFEALGRTGILCRFYRPEAEGDGITWLFGGRTFASGDTVEFGDWLSEYSGCGLVLYANMEAAGSAGVMSITYKNVQVEIGNAVTSYEPYTGGKPSPSPEYPQEIKNVTGEQTITISASSDSQSFTVNLGSIELCKLGDYQDYIWKDGNDWKVHKKTTTRLLDGSEIWENNTGNSFSCSSYSDYALSNNIGFSEIAIGLNNVSGASQFNEIAPNNSFAFNDGTISNRLYFMSLSFSTATELKNWLSANNAKITYAMATPTDITIADQTLIAQLEALASYKTVKGTTNVSVSGDLAAFVRIEAFADNYNGNIASLQAQIDALSS